MDALRDWSLSFAEVGAAELPRIPEQWRPIHSSTDPAERVRAAVALWNKDFLELVPRFAGALPTFVDVRVYLAGGTPALVYVADQQVAWVGFDPHTSSGPPPFWDSFPDPLRVFLRDVHAGFISGGGAGFGPLPPKDMQTLAAVAGFPDGIPGWDEEADIASTRLVLVATDGGLTRLCLSPDLQPGQVALVYEGDIEPEDFGTELDELMMSRLAGR